MAQTVPGSKHASLPQVVISGHTDNKNARRTGIVPRDPRWRNQFCTSARFGRDPLVRGAFGRGLLSVMGVVG